MSEITIVSSYEGVEIWHACGLSVSPACVTVQQQEEIGCKERMKGPESKPIDVQS